MKDPVVTKSGFADLVGYRLDDWREDHAEVIVTVEAKHMNRSGVLHGGMLTTLIDSACGYSGCYSPPDAAPRRAFTLSLNTHFVATAKLGSKLRATGRRTGGGRSVFFAACEVRDQDDRLIGEGKGVFKYISSPQK